MLIRIMLLVSIVALAGGCETIRTNQVTWEFEKNSKKYNQMIRWNELDRADAVFPSEELREKFKEKVKAAKGVKVTDFKVKSMECSVEKGEATVVLEIEYYREPSVTVKTVEDMQKWKYELVGEGDRKWRLVSLPPDFE